MNETEEARKERERQEDLARLRGLRPIDDDFMRCIFRDNIPLAQFVLRILTDIEDLEVTKLETQKDYKRLVGARSICLDAYATDSEGRKYDLEIQRSDRGAGAHRARYHSSAMDIENLDAGQDFDELPDTYTIFITEQDIMGRSRPFYQVERVTLDDGTPFLDGAHILYINGAYRDDTPLGKLMHDFSCWDPADMNYPLMEETTRYYKETKEGVEYMCRAFEEIRDESFNRGIQQGTQQNAVSNIKSLMTNLHLTLNQAMDALNVPDDKRAEYMKMI